MLAYIKRIACQRSGDTRKILGLIRDAPAVPKRKSKPRDRYVHKAPKLGPYSRVYRLAKLDGRTREAALIRRVRDELLAHVGQRPTITQRLLIDRAAILSLRLAQIDRRIFADETLTILDNNQTVAWQNALTRVLVALDVHKEEAAPAMSSLTSVLAEFDRDDVAAE